ncbi:MAG: hypothetical protein HKO62_07165 [Gammaproteobacteria bacterium]|nr:hypothetical protein [Gammaproteobacteria bacterium]NNM00512.1 hypothetical protein [Gammaproteobacteria bacterium]
MSTEIRPAHVEDWLATLPYANFEKCAVMIEDRLADTNRVELKSAQRMELMRLYWQPYRYLLETHIKSETNTAHQSLPRRLRQVDAIRRVVVELAFGCKLALENTNTARGLFRTGKPPLDSYLFALTAHAHVLLLNFHEYSPSPRSAWRELHELYETAEDQDLLQASGADPDSDEARQRTCIHDLYTSICATAVVDPHHLNTGDVWQVYGLARQHAGRIEIRNFSRTDDEAGLFVIDLKNSRAPIAYAKLKLEQTPPQLRLLDCSALAGAVAREYDEVGAEIARRPNERRVQYAALLDQAINAWSKPARRQRPRKVTSGAVDVSLGLKAAHAAMTGKEEDASATPAAAGGDEIVLEDATPGALAETGSLLQLNSWQLVNEGSGGYSLFTDQKIKDGVRVGDVLALRASTDPALPPWRLGVVRWLMLAQGSVHKIGMEMLARNVQAVTVRGIDGAENRTEPRVGFLLQPTAREQPPTLLNSPGLFQAGSALEISDGRGRRTVHADAILERTVAYERYTVSA